MRDNSIIYTLTDEAPLLATCSLFPIVRNILFTSGIFLKTCNISLSVRILSKFSKYLRNEQYFSDDLNYLLKIIDSKYANIIKLPNISASIPQLKLAVNELIKQGYNLPDYEFSKNSEEIFILYNDIIGSVVNPVLRKGNSIRYIPDLIKKYERKNYCYKNNWSNLSKSHVSCMKNGDFYGNELSFIVNDDYDIFNIELNSESGENFILKSNIKLCKGDIFDTSFMDINLLNNFFEKEILDAKKNDLLLSIHLKCTMMKVSDPIIFGVMVYQFYKNILIRYNKELEKVGFNKNNGISDLYRVINFLPDEIRKDINDSIQNIYFNQPKLAMNDYKNGITNLHSPNNLIIDSSMAYMIDDGGKMYGYDGKLYDVKAIIPDRSYFFIYDAIIKDCKKNGSFDKSVIGSISNIGLMSEKAEEYGSHDKTFQIKFNGYLRVVNLKGDIVSEHKVRKGDIWRMCVTKNNSIENWIKLAVDQASKSKLPVIFWLDSNRPHDINIINKVNKYFNKNFIDMPNLHIMNMKEAMYFSLNRFRKGKDTISVTGNVLRDYLTDLFPIIELGTSSKMLSIISLNYGGKLFETGSGGSAPKHVQQFISENYLRWNSLGEFLALKYSLLHNSLLYKNNLSKLFSDTLSLAIEKLLCNKKLPDNKINNIDTRVSHFYLAYFWSEELAKQNKYLFLKNKFFKFFNFLSKNEEKILLELNINKGVKVNIGGYYHPDILLLNNIMRPSLTFNKSFQYLEY